MDSFTLPSASTTIAGIAAYSSPIFTEYLPIIYITIGLSAAGLLLLFLTRKGSGFFGRLLKGRRGRRR